MGWPRICFSRRPEMTSPASAHRIARPRCLEQVCSTRILIVPTGPCSPPPRVRYRVSPQEDRPACLRWLAVRQLRQGPRCPCLPDRGAEDRQEGPQGVPAEEALNGQPEGLRGELYISGRSQRMRIQNRDGLLRLFGARTLCLTSVRRSMGGNDRTGCTNKKEISQRFSACTPTLAALLRYLLLSIMVFQVVTNSFTWSFCHQLQQPSSGSPQRNYAAQVPSAENA